MLCSAVISTMTPKCQFTASHSGSLEEDGSHIFCFLAFILIQNESILNTEPCGNGKKYRPFHPKWAISPELVTLNLQQTRFCAAVGFLVVGPFPDSPTRLPSVVLRQQYPAIPLWQIKKFQKCLCKTPASKNRF